MATRADVDRLTAAVGRLTGLALGDLTEWLSSVDLRGPERVRDELLEVLPRLVDRYGDMSATVAAEWYEDLRGEAETSLYVARLADGTMALEVERTARWAAGALWGDDPAALLRTLGGPLERFIHYSGRETVRQNVYQDRSKPRYARVPGRSGCCAWCRMLSARGFAYSSAEKAGAVSHYHDHCNCEVVPEWGATRSHIAGYDPDQYMAEYQAARKAAVRDGLAATPENILHKWRQQNPGVLTDGEGIER
ncbi:VG15 protein [Actinomyces bowdenii]|uniref:VG15 protein n=1 Tax=Actinomyces bowdenii TaxID=131109 RepID=UPI00403D09A8